LHKIQKEILGQSLSTSIQSIGIERSS